MRTIALDLGARKITYCEMEQGQVVARTTVRKLRELMGRLGPNTAPARVAFEACRAGWHVHRRLLEWGHQPVMVDTTRVRQLGIGHHGRKNDEIDPEVLARALEQDRIPAAHVLSEHRQELRYHLGVRRALVKTRAELVGGARELVRARGERIPSCETKAFVQKARQTKLSEGTRGLLEPLLVPLGVLNEQIDQMEQQLWQVSQKEPVIELLTSAPGVGPIVGATVVSVLEEAHRFQNAHQVESYVGLVPTEETSGKRKLGGISKEGNTYCRTMLVQAAWCILRRKNSDDPLALWGHTILQRRGKKIAVVAVARRLLGVLWAMWRDDRPYDAQRLAQASAFGLKQQAQKVEAQAKEQKRAARKGKASRKAA